jgi:hypothetical protein
MKIILVGVPSAVILPMTDGSSGSLAGHIGSSEAWSIAVNSPWNDAAFAPGTGIDG